MSAVSGPLKKRPRLSEPDDAGAQETALLPSEEGSAFVVDDGEGRVSVGGGEPTVGRSVGTLVGGIVVGDPV